MDFLMSRSSPYTSPPTTPNALQFFSAPGSHTPTEENMKTNDDDDDDLSSCLNSFEFETSKKFGIYVQFEDTNVADQEKRQGKARHERGGSLQTMAFADELFYNGQVMPLKLPPRLNQPYIPTPPRSPVSYKVPFVHRHKSWNDDFDPFMTALQIVKEENRGRTSSVHAGKPHRRSRSLSPFRVMPLEDEFEEPNKKDSQDEGVVDSDEKSKGIKGILRRCATLWKEKENGEEEKSTRKWKSSYLKKLSSKFKGNEKKNKRVIETPKTSVVGYNKRNKLTLPLCFYGIESPRIMR